MDYVCTRVIVTFWDTIHVEEKQTVCFQGNKVDLQKQLVSSKVGRADWEKVILKYSKNADFWKAKFIVYPLATDSLIDSRNSVWNFKSR